MAKLWGGRFQKNTDSKVDDFNSSIRFDKRMYKQDIKGSIAHARMLGKQNIIRQEDSDKIIKGLKEIPGIIIHNETCETGIISFNIEGVHPHDAASVYDKNDVCIRAGHHCAQLITSWLDTIGTVRASFYFYNTLDDVKKFVSATKEASEFFNMF